MKLPRAREHLPSAERESPQPSGPGLSEGATLKSACLE